MFSYENFKNIIRKNSTEKIQNVIFGSWYGNTIKFIIGVVLFVEVLFYTIARYNFYIFFLLYIVILISAMIYISTRKAGLALTKNNFVCIIFHHIKNTPKEIYEIPKDKLKSLTVHKIFYLCFVSVSFIDNTGRLKNKKIYFSNFIVGPHRQEFKEDSINLYKEFKKIEHIMEKGDF